MVACEAMPRIRDLSSFSNPFMTDSTVISAVTPRTRRIPNKWSKTLTSPLLWEVTALRRFYLLGRRSPSAAAPTRLVGPIGKVAEQWSPSNVADCYVWNLNSIARPGAEYAGWRAV